MHSTCAVGERPVTFSVAGLKIFTPSLFPHLRNYSENVTGSKAATHANMEGASTSRQTRVYGEPRVLSNHQNSVKPSNLSQVLKMCYPLSPHPGGIKNTRFWLPGNI